MLRIVMKEMVKQAPSLAVLSVIVWMFLGEIRGNREFMRDLADACHITHRVSSEVISDNTKMLGRLERVIDNLGNG